MNKQSEAMKHWVEETGTQPVKRPGITVEYIMDFCSEGLHDRETDEIETFLTNVEMYNLYLRNLMGSTLSEIRMVQQELNEQVAAHIHEFSGVYVSNHIKEAMVCDEHEEIGEQKRRLTFLQMKYDKIKNLPQSIDSFIRTTQQKLRRINGGW